MHRLSLVVVGMAFVQGCGSKKENKQPPAETKTAETGSAGNTGRAGSDTMAAAAGSAGAGSGSGAGSAVEMVEPKPAGKTFFIELATDGKAKEYPVACLTNIVPPFVVMAPSSKKAKGPCDVTGEDDFAFSIEFFPCGKDVKGACALPAPGTKLPGTFSVTHGNRVTGDVDVIVVKKERPYLVVRIDRLDGDEGSAGGDLKILIEDGHPAIDAASWK